MVVGGGRRRLVNRLLGSCHTHVLHVHISKYFHLRENNALVKPGVPQPHHFQASGKMCMCAEPQYPNLCHNHRAKTRKYPQLFPNTFKPFLSVSPLHQSTGKPRTFHFSRQTYGTIVAELCCHLALIVLSALSACVFSHWWDHFQAALSHHGFLTQFITTTVARNLVQSALVLPPKGNGWIS